MLLMLPESYTFSMEPQVVLSFLLVSSSPFPFPLSCLPFFFLLSPFPSFLPLSPFPFLPLLHSSLFSSSFFSTLPLAFFFPHFSPHCFSFFPMPFSSSSGMHNLTSPSIHPPLSYSFSSVLFFYYFPYLWWSSPWPHTCNHCFRNPHPHLYCSIFVAVLAIGYFSLAKDSIILMIFLLLPLGFRDYKHGPTCLSFTFSHLKEALIWATLHALDIGN